MVRSSLSSFGLPLSENLTKTVPEMFITDISENTFGKLFFTDKTKKTKLEMHHGNRRKARI